MASDLSLNIFTSNIIAPMNSIRLQSQAFQKINKRLSNFCETNFNSGYSANTGSMLQMPPVQVGPVHLQVMGRDRSKTVCGEIQC
ncbi:MAG TPA: hypothetical protein DIT85_00190 [Pantoea ananatis]|nr:hypothetical protein [Pantoea ananatis]